MEDPAKKSEEAFKRADKAFEKADKAFDAMEEAVDEMSKALGNSATAHESVMSKTFRFSSTIAAEKTVETETIVYRFRAFSWRRRFSLCWLFVSTGLRALFKGQTLLRVAAPKESTSN